MFKFIPHLVKRVDRLLNIDWDIPQINSLLPFNIIHKACRRLIDDEMAFDDAFECVPEIIVPNHLIGHTQLHEICSTRAWNCSIIVRVCAN